MEYILNNPITWQRPKSNGIQLIWVTPLRALAQDYSACMQEVCQVIWSSLASIGFAMEIQMQKPCCIERKPTECLITTPETLHILISQKDHTKLFENLQVVIVDEWHELVRKTNVACKSNLH